MMYSYTEINTSTLFVTCYVLLHKITDMQWFHGRIQNNEPNISYNRVVGGGTNGIILPNPASFIQGCMLCLHLVRYYHSISSESGKKLWYKWCNQIYHISTPITCTLIWNNFNLHLYLELFWGTMFCRMNDWDDFLLALVWINTVSCEKKIITGETNTSIQVQKKEHTKENL